MPTERSEEFLIRSRSVVSRVVSGETLIVPVRGKVGDLASIYSFNGTGTLIWKLLDHPTTVEDVVVSVMEEYAVSQEQAHEDVMRFVEDMRSVGLVEFCQAAAVVAEASGQNVWETAATR